MNVESIWYLGGGKPSDGKPLPAPKDTPTEYASCTCIVPPDPKPSPKPTPPGKPAAPGAR